MHTLKRKEEIIRLSLTSGLMMGSIVLVVMLFYAAVVLG